MSFDGPNVNTKDCQEEMAELAEENGTDLDGTPVINRLSDIRKLERMGCVRLRNRALDGSQGFPWLI